MIHVPLPKESKYHHPLNNIPLIGSWYGAIEVEDAALE